MEERKLTFGEHLEELRLRVIYSILAVGVAFIVCWCFSDHIMYFLAGPHRRIMRAMHMPEDLKILNYTEGFFTYMRVSLVAAIFIAAPVVVYNLWKFISEGLYPEERRYVYYFAPASLGLFLLGMLFGFFVLIPAGLRFHVGIARGVATPLIRLDEYISLLVVLTLVLGVVFELPLVMYFLYRIGLVQPEMYRENRRYAYFALICLGMFVSPSGDPVNQSLIALPMVGLYEVGMFLCRPTLKHLLWIVGVSAAFVGGAYGIYALVTAKPNTLGVAVGLGGNPLQYKATSEGKYLDLARGARIIAGMTVRTELGDRSKIDLDKGGELKLDSDTELRVEAQNRVFVENGRVFASLPKDHPMLTVATRDGEVEVREGEADIQAEPEGTRLIAAKGEQTAIVDGVRRPVFEGRSIAFTQGGEPVDVKRKTRWANFK